LDITTGGGTDATLVHLEELNQLSRLILCGSKVRDIELVDLASLWRLQTLTLDVSKVTEQGVENLQRALPNCEKLVLCHS
jgi:hypothetical protein